MTTKTKRRSLLELKKYCERYDVTVSANASEEQPEIVLTAPPGSQFAPELHDLVSSAWDEEDFQDCINNAYADAVLYCSGIAKCPPDCPCNDD